MEGIFRLNGSAKRIKDLQVLFDSPDRYGKGLDWTGYTVHDAANILRRYLNQLPEPVVPLDFYERFRDPIRGHEMQAVGDLEAQAHDVGGFDEEATIKVYQQLITELPPLSRQLLLYILDLLAVFASKSDLNRMSSTNLAAIFQPGMLSHPTHDMSPAEYRLSQDVLVFLIENQDHFLIGMRGTAADDETVKEVQSGGTPQATTPTAGIHPRATGGLGRSSSTASAGAESLRRYGGVRRNVSVSSRHSKTSNHIPSPVSPAPASPTTAGNIHRSNTVPSKKSPAIPSGRFSRLTEPSAPSPTGNEATSTSPHSPNATSTPSNLSTGPVIVSEPPPVVNENPESHSAYQQTASSDAPQTGATPSNGGLNAGLGMTGVEPSPSHDPTHLDPSIPAVRNTGTPTKERNFSTLFNRSPTSDTERKDTRAPNKLRKKRMPGSGNASAHSSNGSLHDDLA